METGHLGSRGQSGQRSGGEARGLARGLTSAVAARAGRRPPAAGPARATPEVRRAQARAPSRERTPCRRDGPAAGTGRFRAVRADELWSSRAWRPRCAGAPKAHRCGHQRTAKGRRALLSRAAVLRGCKEGERRCRISSNFLVGPLEVRGGDRSLALGGRKQRSLSLSDDHELPVSPRRSSSSCARNVTRSAARE